MAHFSRLGCSYSDTELPWTKCCASMPIVFNKGIPLDWAISELFKEFVFWKVLDVHLRGKSGVCST